MVLTTVLYTPLTDLIQKATHQSASRTSVWKTLPDTPLLVSTAASLSGSLLAVGGFSDKTAMSTVVHVRLPPPWVRFTTGDLPEPYYGSAAVQLSSNQVLVVGGGDNWVKYTKTVFLGSITI